MSRRFQRRRQHVRADAPQQMFLRAVVGCAVVCVTLGTADANARTVSQYAGAALVRASSVVFQTQAHAPHILHVRAVRAAAPFAGARADDWDARSAQSCAHLFASASGKQFSRAPGMTRERAGNLIRQNLALP